MPPPRVGVARRRRGWRFHLRRALLPTREVKSGDGIQRLRDGGPLLSLRLISRTTFDPSPSCSIHGRCASSSLRAACRIHGDGGGARGRAVWCILLHIINCMKCDLNWACWWIGKGVTEEVDAALPSSDWLCSSNWIGVLLASRQDWVGQREWQEQQQLGCMVGIGGQLGLEDRAWAGRPSIEKAAWVTASHRVSITFGNGGLKSMFRMLARRHPSIRLAHRPPRGIAKLAVGTINIKFIKVNCSMYLSL
ncbi:unnamed protein product [Urochloa humidicola]